jgi:hypothetical protein
MIHTSCPTEKKIDLEDPSNPVTSNLCKSQGEECGDVLICSLWVGRTDCIIDIHVTDTDAKSNLSIDPTKVLEAHKWGKKRKYLKDCLEQCHHFTPFLVSTDSLISREAKTLTKKLSAMLVGKWEKPYAEVCGYVSAQ